MAISFFNKTQTSASEVLGSAIADIAKAKEDIGKYKSMKAGDLFAARAEEVVAKLFETTGNIVAAPRANSIEPEQLAPDSSVTLKF